MGPGRLHENGTDDPQIERVLRVLGRSLRLAEAESTANVPPSTKWPRLRGFLRGILEFVKAIVPVLVAVVTGGIGYLLFVYGQGALEVQKLEIEQQKAALDARRVALSEINQIQPLLATLLTETAPDRGKAESVALLVASFGGIAVRPLVRIMDFGDPNRVLAAESGLRLAAVYDHPAVCSALEVTIVSRTRLYSWQTQRYALDLLGQLHCRETRGAIEDLLALLASGLEEYRLTVRVDRAVDMVGDVELQHLEKAATQALEHLGAAEANAGSRGGQ